MKEQKGILGKMLSVTGVILVVVGVFVFQSFSHAEDTTENTGGNGNVGVTIIPGASDEEGEEDGEAEDCVPVVCEEDDEDCVPKECEEECVPVVCEEDDEGCEPKECEEEGEEEECVPVVCEEDDDECEPKECEEEKEKVLQIFTLRYNANGGTGAPSAQVCESYDGECGFVVADSVPVREGYEFRGWAKDGDTNDVYQPRATVVNDDAEEPLTLYAVWAEIKTYTLMYEVNGGSGAPEVQSCKSASGKCSFVVSGVMPTRNGFEFLNWIHGDVTYAGGSEFIATEAVTILIANWNPIYSFSLNYVSDEGTENLPEPQKCETTMGTCTFIVSTKEPTRTGYEFLGWYWEDQPDMRAKAGDELVVGVEGALELKIHAAWSRVYAVLNSGEVFGAGERVILRSAATYEWFKGLSIDSVEVPAEYYTVSEGETTSVVLSNAFSQSLATGEHAFVIDWADGKAGGVISVSQNEDGTKRFVVVDANGNADSINLMYRPKAGAVSKESTSAATDAATENKESGFDAIKVLILVAAGTFVIVFIVNKVYIKKRMNFIDEL